MQPLRPDKIVRKYHQMSIRKINNSLHKGWKGIYKKIGDIFNVDKMLLDVRYCKNNSKEKNIKEKLAWV
jgi:hypothetical protein